MEKRKLTRVKLWFKATAIVKSKTQTVWGDVRDIGSKGMFLYTDDRISVLESVKIKILFNSNSSEGEEKSKTATSNEIDQRQSIDIKGFIRRHTQMGMAIYFDGMDINQYRKCVISIINSWSSTNDDR